MDLLWPVALLLCGILAASTLIIQKKPDAKELIDKLVPIQGYLGVVACLLGLWGIIRLLLNIGAFLKYSPMHFVVYMAIAVLMAGLGFLLGYGLISQYALSKNPEAAAKGAELRAKLTKFQIPMGLAGIALGLVGIVMNFIH